MAVRHRRLPNGAYETVDNVDANLEAAATPISVEPTAGKPRDLRQEQIDRLVAAGDDPQTAAMVVDRLREINGGEIPAGLFDSYNTPEGNADLARRIAESKAANARMAAFETNYNAETGHPEYGYDEAGNAAKLGKVDIRNPNQGERHGNRSGVGTRAAIRRAHWRGANTSELDYQNYPSDYEYDPDGANRPFGGEVDSGPTREEMWAQAEAERLAQNKAEREKYGTGSERQITADQLAARRERTYAEDKMRANPAVEEARIKRLAKAAGVSMSEARASYEAGMKDRVEGEPITFDELRRGTQGLRDMATDRRLAEQKAARDNWRATAMLAGGSQNLNSGNRWIANALVGMKPEEQDKAMRYMLPGGQLHAQVDAANAEAAAVMAQRAVTNFLADNPGASELQREGLQGKRRLEAQDWFDKWLYQNHGTRGQGGFTVGPYTAASMDNAVNYMMQVYGLSRPEAEAIAQSQGVPGVSQSPAEAGAGAAGGPGGFGGAPAGGPGGF